MPLRAPQAELGAHTRERLLDVAERLFAESGYSATSVRDITRVAECNLASVNYHFGGKHNLYLEVLRRRMASLRDDRISSVEHVMATGQPDVKTVLRAFASAFLGPLVTPSQGRQLIELIAREMLDPQLPRELFLAELVGPVQEVLVDALVVAIPELTRDNARLCVFSVMGQLIHVAHQARWTELAGVPDSRVPRLEAIVRHVVRFSAAGVRACSGGAK